MGRSHRQAFSIKNVSRALASFLESGPISEHLDEALKWFAATDVFGKSDAQLALRDPVVDCFSVIIESSIHFVGAAGIVDD